MEYAYFQDCVLTSVNKSKGQFKKEHIPWNKGDWWSYQKASKYMQGTAINTKSEFNAKKSQLEPVKKKQIPKDPPTSYPNFFEMGGWPIFLTGKLRTLLTKEEKKKNKILSMKKHLSNPENRYMKKFTNGLIIIHIGENEVNIPKRISPIRI